MLIIGVDNGLDGAIVALNSTGQVQLREVTPTIGTGKREFDDREMARILASVTSAYAATVFLERAQAMPGQGVSSMFSVGLGYGLWRGIIAAAGVPVEIVSPRAWQSVMFAGVNKDDTKAASAIVASRLSPGDWRKNERCRVAHDGLTDAYCIAEYGRRQLVKRGLIHESPMAKVR